MRLLSVILPEIGIGPGAEIVVSHWFYQIGEDVLEGQRLVEILVGAATFDVPAPIAGQLTEIRCDEDDRVRPGQVLGILAVDESACAPPGV